MKDILRQVHRIYLHLLMNFVRLLQEDEINSKKIDHQILIDHNEFLNDSLSIESFFTNNSPLSFVRITSIDIIVLHPSRKISHVSDIFPSFESSVCLLDAVVVRLSLSFVVECCLNQTNERSSNLNQPQRSILILSKEIYFDKE
jgi:hypothetical protein